MKATTAPAIEHSASSQALHDQNKGNSAFFGPASESKTPFFTPRIQTKLTIGRPGDKYEQEADNVADRVVQRLSNPQAAAPAVQRQCTDCEEKERLQRKEEEEERETPELMRKEADEEEETPPVQAKEKEEEEKPGIMRQAGPEEEEPLQTKATPDGAASPSPSLESRLSSAKGSGAAMDKSTRQPMEAAFGQDFSRVRIHTDSGAAQMNRELNARAFTHGRNIYFNAGEYSPGSTEGRRLLAHELVHVGQQGIGNNQIQREIRDTDTSLQKNVPSPSTTVQLLKPSPAPFLITTETIFPAPSGAPKTRRTIGLGEPILFSTTQGSPVKWHITGSASHPVRPVARTRVYWTRTGNFRISAQIRGRTAWARIRVIEPGMEPVKLRDLTLAQVQAQLLANGIIPSMAPHRRGVFMELHLRLTPNTVSFRGLRFREVGGPASHVVGYFRGRARSHTPVPGFLGVISLNRHNVVSRTDYAGFSINPVGANLPVTAGSYRWIIPAEVQIGRLTRRLSTKMTQIFSVTPSPATITRPPLTGQFDVWKNTAHAQAVFNP